MENVINWNTLVHAYGSADDLPARIRAWAKTGSQQLLHDLFGCLCHQGTVYSASFEAVPLIFDACNFVSPAQRRGALILIGAIWASTDRYHDAHPSKAVIQLIPEIEKMTIAAMDNKDIELHELPYLMYSVAAFRDEHFWVGQLDLLGDGMLPGLCPKCAERLEIPICINSVYVHDNLAALKNRHEIRIVSGKLEELPEFGLWLYEKALQHNRSDIAACILQMFGQINCPACGNSNRINEALHRYLQQ